MPRKDPEAYKAYNRDRYARMYPERKAHYIAKLGGVCVSCGTTENLEFDHIDRSTKSFTFTDKIASMSIKKLDIEAEKLQLLCNDCHKEKTSLNQDDDSVGHGGGNSGKRNCKCAPCKAKKAEYMKARQAVYQARRDEGRRSGRITT